MCTFSGSRRVTEAPGKGSCRSTGTSARLTASSLPHRMGTWATGQCEGNWRERVPQALDPTPQSMQEIFYVYCVLGPRVIVLYKRENITVKFLILADPQCTP